MLMLSGFDLQNGVTLLERQSALSGVVLARVRCRRYIITRTPKCTKEIRAPKIWLAKACSRIQFARASLSRMLITPVMAL
jgi:hypothetical protein